MAESPEIPLKTAQEGQPATLAACPECGVQFKQGRKVQRFCSTACKNRFHYKGGPLERLAALEARVAELEQAVALVRGHLVL